jgi:RNase P/RNase MRP subunit p29
VRVVVLIVCALLFVPQVALSAAAQDRISVSGTVVSVSGNSVVVETSSGRKTVVYDAKVRFFGVRSSSLDQVTANAFVGTAVSPQPDGSFQSTEVHIFAPSLRGTGEGFTKMTGPGGHMMANSTVQTIAQPNMMANSTVRTVGGGASGKTITMVFPSGTKVIHIAAGTPIVYIEPGTTAMLTRGTHVRVVATENGQTLVAKFILAGEHGLVPPM